MRNTNHDRHGFYQVIWLGAILRFWLNRKQKQFIDYYQPEDQIKNFIIGLTAILGIILVIFSAIYWVELT